MRDRRLSRVELRVRRLAFLGAQLVLGLGNHAVFIVAVGDGVEMGEATPCSLCSRAVVIHVQQIATGVFLPDEQLLQAPVRT